MKHYTYSVFMFSVLHIGLVMLYFCIFCNSISGYSCVDIEC